MSPVAASKAAEAWRAVNLPNWQAGGYGDPLKGDPEMVRLGAIRGYVSFKSAKEDYRIVLDPKTLETDWKATRELRHQMKTG